MNTRILATGCVLAISVLVSGTSGQTVATSSPDHAGSAIRTACPDVTAQREMLDKYCVGCHNEKLKRPNLLLDKLDIAHLPDHAEIGEKIIRKASCGHDAATGNVTARTCRNGDTDPIYGKSARPKCRIQSHSAGHPPTQSNRICKCDSRHASSRSGCHEISTSRRFHSRLRQHRRSSELSPALMEAYLSAAGKISRLAIGDVSAPTQAVFEVPPDTAQNFHIEGLPFGTRGGILIKYQFPADGEYSFKVKGVTGYFQAVLGGVKGEQLEVTVDGERVKLFDWDKEIANTTGNGRSTPRIPVKAGLHTVGVTFLATNDVPGSELDRPFQRTMNTPGSIPGFLFYPHVGQVWIEGPYNAAGAAETASRRKIFTLPAGN